MNSTSFPTNDALEQFFVANGIDFDRDPAVLVSEITQAEQSQVRESKHRAPKNNVDAYAWSMANEGTTFPAVVINERHQTVDGNTRIEAMKKAFRKEYRQGTLTIAAYMVKHTVPTVDQMIGVWANEGHGEKLTTAEKAAHMREFFSQGLTTEQVAAALRVPRKRVRTLRDRWDFDERSKRIGLNGRAERLPAMVKGSLAGIRNDNMLRDAAELAADANLKVSEVKDLLVKPIIAGELPTETDAAKHVADLRRDLATRITATKAGVRKPPDSSRLRMHIAAIVGVKAELQVEADSTHIANHLEMVDKAIAHLGAVRAAQPEPLPAGGQ